MLRFCPLNCLNSVKSDAERIAVIILNKDLASDHADPVFSKLWKRAAFRACADGGANFVYDVQKESTNGNASLMPDLISGDFDSIRLEVKDFFEKETATTVIHTPDQDETDFTKCVRLIADKMHKKEVDTNVIIAVGGKQDRFDHSMANIHTLYKTKELLPFGVRICLLFGSSYVCLLPKGKTVIEVDTGLEGNWCGLIPIGGPVTVTTTGLKWNLNGHKLEFGGLISTSNELDGSEEVTVETDHPLIWTIAFKL